MEKRVTLQIIPTLELGEDGIILLIPYSLHATIDKDTDSFLSFLKEIKGSFKKYYGKDINKILLT